MARLPKKMESADPARVYDNALSWNVPSRETAGVEYHVELADYAHNGRCDCVDFCTRFEKLLSRGYTPERALAEGLVKLRKYHNEDPKNALRCWHIMQARWSLAERTIAAFDAARKEVRTGPEWRHD